MVFTVSADLSKEEVRVDVERALDGISLSEVFETFQWPDMPNMFTLTTRESTTQAYEHCKKLKEVIDAHKASASQVLIGNYLDAC